MDKDLMRLFQDAKDAGCVVQVGPCRTPPPSFSPARPGYNALYSTPEAPPTRNMLPRFLVNERERGLCVGAMGDCEVGFSHSDSPESVRETMILSRFGNIDARSALY